MQWYISTIPYIFVMKEVYFLYDFDDDAYIRVEQTRENLEKYKHDLKKLIKQEYHLYDKYDSDNRLFLVTCDDDFVVFSEMKYPSSWEEFNKDSKEYYYD